MTNGQRPCAVHARTSCSNPSKPALLATGLVLMLKHGYLVDHMITTWELIYISRMLGAMGKSSSMWPVHETLCSTISKLPAKFESSMRNHHKFENPITVQNLWRPLSCETAGFYQPTTSCVTPRFRPKRCRANPLRCPVSKSQTFTRSIRSVKRGKHLGKASYVLRTFAASKHGNEWKFRLFQKNISKTKLVDAWWLCYD